MALGKISEYAAQFNASLNDSDIRIDVSHDTTGGGAWVTKFMLGSNLVTQLKSDIPTIYTGDSSLTSTRALGMAGFNLSYTGTGFFCCWRFIYIGL